MMFYEREWLASESPEILSGYKHMEYELSLDTELIEKIDALLASKPKGTK